MLHDDLADGDRHLIMGPGLRRVYTVDRYTQVVGMVQGTDLGRRIDMEQADLANNRYLRGLGWGD